MQLAPMQRLRGAQQHDLGAQHTFDIVHALASSGRVYRLVGGFSAVKRELERRVFDTGARVRVAGGPVRPQCQCSCRIEHGMRVGIPRLCRVVGTERRVETRPDARVIGEFTGDARDRTVEQLPDGAGWPHADERILRHR